MYTIYQHQNAWHARHFTIFSCSCPLARCNGTTWCCATVGFQNNAMRFEQKCIGGKCLDFQMIFGQSGLRSGAYPPVSTNIAFWEFQSMVLGMNTVS